MFAISWQKFVFVKQRVSMPLIFKSKDIIDTKHVPPSEVKVTKLERKSVKKYTKIFPSLACF